MTRSGIQIKVEGLREAQRDMERMANDLTGAPMVGAMRQAAQIVTRDAG